MKQLTLSLLLILGRLVSLHGEDLAIIVAPGVHLDNLSQAELGQVFLMDKKTSTATHLVVLMREKTAPERAVIMKDVYKMTEAQFEAYFLQATFTGMLTTPPRMIPSAPAVRKLVANNPGMIGYVASSLVDASVKVVKVDGHAPGETGYPLKL